MSEHGRCSPAVTTRRLSAFLVLAAAVACGGGGDPAPDPAPALPALVDGGSVQDAHQVGTTFFADGATATGGTGSPVAGIDCAASELTATKFTHLSIVRDGQPLAIPGRVGVVRDNAGNLVCVYSIHTHTDDRSGRIHTEGPVPATYNLGQFFAIWGMPLQTNNVAGITDKPLTAVYVVDNDTVTPFTGDPATIELTSHRHIVLQLGTAITRIPVYTWNGP